MERRRFIPELVGKRLELLTQAVPGVSRIAVLRHPSDYGERTEREMLREAEVAARALGVRLQVVEARGPENFDRAFSAMTRARADAVTVQSTNIFLIERRRLVDLAAKNRLPAMYLAREFVDAGGLMSYVPNVPNLFRRAATYVDKILLSGGATVTNLDKRNRPIFQSLAPDPNRFRSFRSVWLGGRVGGKMAA